MLSRLWTLIAKEMQALFSDADTRAVLIVPVILQALLFPYAATLEVKNATLAIYNEDNGLQSMELIQRLAMADSFSRTILLHNPQEIKTTIDNQRALLLIRFPVDFSQNIINGNTASIQLLLDGRSSNSARIAANYAQSIILQYQNEILADYGYEKPNNSELIIRNWYNPSLDFKWMIIPSLIAMIATIGVLMVTALSVAREREQGTLDQLLVSPITTWQLFIGEAVPAVCVAFFQATLVLLIGIFLFSIPFSGSLWLFYFSMLIYGLSLVGFGLFISSLCQTQQQAFIGTFGMVMPAILLSGAISPVENMPQWLQHLTMLNPMRHFVNITKQIYLKDASINIVWESLWPLMIITVLTGGIAYIIFRSKIV
ncbi:ABC transporter permease [Serratia sp. T13T92]|jgi:ABC-2 type transport system permease protein|uniref:ABC transporter permease n=1 Tax=Serratia TaxID=613 RepID=UPI000EF52557|nr:MULTISPECIES: ABC transporter permease [Serratia]AYM91003.1 ABC transporter permease [Serratia sp. 3ACOL1]MBL5862188.1 ABC transporter permease [Serratia fonticola]MDK2374512.1 ABC transporter permease [Serratia fonticola]